MRHFAFRADGANFERARKDFRERGIQFSQQDHGISHSIYLTDPDGYLVEITTYDLAR
jgi:catechol-2,3-dioxygenase